jgi:5,10-methylene-tetrahydrofolate dehydrogenase/methenyl tetrahydrofolate cyclohydrolase
MKVATRTAINIARASPSRGFQPHLLSGSPRLSFSTSRSLRAIASLDRESNEGRSVIVTGSSRGIGKSIALRLAADGYNVCINDIGANAKGCDEVVKEIKSMGRKACSAIADVSKRDEVAQMVQTSVKELGPLNAM